MSSTSIGSRKTTVFLAKPYNSITLINTLLEDTIDIASTPCAKISVAKLPMQKQSGLVMTIVDHSISPNKNNKPGKAAFNSAGGVAKLMDI